MEGFTEEVLAQIEEINKKIAAKEAEKDALYTSLGKYTYEKDTPDRDELIKDVIIKLDGINLEIQAFNVEILEAKGFKICPTCNSEVQKELMYCGNCGTRMISDVEKVDGGVVCNKCGAVMDEDKKFCTRCGAQLGTEAEKAPEKKMKSEPQTKTCPLCGKSLKVNAKFCSGCGVKLD